jgi:predicted GIY-YIG superfamily endonuclease
MWQVYILLCIDGSLYTGITNNMEKRFARHLTGKASKYTRIHRPVKIVYQETQPDRSSALRREWEIKKLNSAQKKLLLNIY